MVVHRDRLAVLAGKRRVTLGNRRFAMLRAERLVTQAREEPGHANHFRRGRGYLTAVF